jgi:hypothetical protein
LSKKIEDSIDKKVSSHTLRRFFGIVLWHGQFRIKTMDILAHYAGYTSINTFVQELQSQANLTMYFENGEEKQKDSYLYEQLILKSPSLESIMVVGACIREALIREDIERVMQLLRALEPMAKKHQIHINALMLFAQYVAPMLCQVQEEMVVKRFIEDTPYVRLVLCQFVPVLELNGEFGNHIRWMLKYSTNHEHLAFGYSLFGSSSWRENDKEKAREYTRLAIKNREQLSSIHPILRGRIDFLSKIADNGIKTNLNASDFNPPKNQHLLTFPRLRLKLCSTDKKNGASSYAIPSILVRKTSTIGLKRVSSQCKKSRVYTVNVGFGPKGKYEKNFKKKRAQPGQRITKRLQRK